MTLRAYPDDPHAALRAADRDLEHYIELLAGDGLDDGIRRTAAHYIRVAAKARKQARERIAQGSERCSHTMKTIEQV